MNNLKELRTTYNLTQEQFAETLGLSKYAICKYEQGTRQIDSVNLIKIAEQYNVSVDYILGRGKKEVIKRTEQRPAETRNQQLLYDSFEHLNELGQIKAIAYIQGLLSSNEFKKYRGDSL